MTALDLARIAAEVERPPRVLGGRGAMVADVAGDVEVVARGVLERIAFVPTREEVRGGAGVSAGEEGVGSGLEDAPPSIEIGDKSG
ncbi:hypothetical protein [Streptomyces fractus]|uniref:hypothetical protein n=1 Tax=Streptomyces fractus TaxID=641806 RepID=UPI003CF2A84E